MEEIKILDHGYIKLIESWGSDRRIIESARMSTQKGFKGWGYWQCNNCHEAFETQIEGCPCCGNEHFTYIQGDEKFLAYLWKNKHMTPFEMSGATFEISAPIFVFREWMRHRTQSYNEASARFIALPNENYLPTVDRLFLAKNEKNK